MEKDIMSTAVKATEAQLPINLDINKGVMETATEEMTEQQAKEITELNQARTRNAIDANSFSEEQLKMLRPRKPIQQVRNYKKIGRNEMCPCGSGKKYKNCCLDSKKYEGYHNVGEEPNVA